MPIKDWSVALNQFAILCGTDDQKWTNVDQRWTNSDIILIQSF
ncbi:MULTISPECIES: hypothetical protein [unclassified Candidatus Tisiphia]